LLATVLGVLFTKAQAGDSVWFAGPWSHTWVGEHTLGWLVAGASGALMYRLLRTLGGQESHFTEPSSATGMQLETELALAGSTQPVVGGLGGANA